MNDSFKDHEQDLKDEWEKGRTKRAEIAAKKEEEEERAIAGKRDQQGQLHQQQQILLTCGFYYSEKHFSEQYKNDQLTQDIILASKKGDRNAASRVCEKMYEKLQQEHITEFNMIVPVPNYESDNRCKAPFLAEVLATTIHEKTGRNIPFHDTQDVLVRVNPSNQDRKSMTEEERRRTTKENYKIAEKIKYNNIIQDKIILLIDDIHVTGSTIDSCTDLLLQNGAKQVIQLCAGKNKRKY